MSLLNACSQAPTSEVGEKHPFANHFSYQVSIKKKHGNIIQVYSPLTNPEIPKKNIPRIHLKNNLYPRKRMMLFKSGHKKTSKLPVVSVKPNRTTVSTFPCIVAYDVMVPLLLWHPGYHQRPTHQQRLVAWHLGEICPWDVGGASHGSPGIGCIYPLNILNCRYINQPH